MIELWWHAPFVTAFCLLGCPSYRKYKGSSVADITIEEWMQQQATRNGWGIINVSSALSANTLTTIQTAENIWPFIWSPEEHDHSRGVKSLHILSHKWHGVVNPCPGYFLFPDNPGWDNSYRLFWGLKLDHCIDRQASNRYCGSTDKDIEMA